MTIPSQIAYIKIGENSGTNRSVEQVLKRAFPLFEVRTLDVTHDLFHNSLKAVLFQSVSAVREYGWAVLSGTKNIHSDFYTTRYFQRVRQLARQAIRPDQFAFSFQTQSLFDASVPNLPHFVYTDHTHLANLSYPGYDKRALCSPSWIDLEKTIYHNAALVFTMSANIRRSVIEEYGCPPDKVVCVYGGCNAPIDAEPSSVKNYGNKTILFVGVDWQRKGGPELVRAFENVMKIHPDARLIIAGCNPALTTPNCTVMGPVPLTEVPALYRQASLFCLPTRREPFGIAFIEAMFNRLPVIGTTIGAIPDFIEQGKNGYLVEPGNIDQLTRALLNLLGDPNRCRAFGEHGYALASERYTWDKVGSAMKAHILRRLPHLSGHSSGRSC